MPIKITEHAYERAKERLRFKSEVLDKMAAVAYEEGLKHSESKGLLKKYITSLFFQYGGGEMESKSWGMEEGVLISGNDAVYIINQLEK